MDTPRQGIPLFTAICVLVGTLVVIQLWLLSAALDALLGGHTTVLWPAAAASIVLFVLNGRLLLHARNFDRRLRHRGPDGGA
jgi:F0F1-type ATP synthase assembly protein I